MPNGAQAKKSRDLSIRVLDIDAGVNVVIMNEDDARERGVLPTDRILLKKGSRETICIVDTTAHILPKGVLGVFRNVARDMELSDNDRVSLGYVQRSIAVDYIKKKMDKHPLTEEEIHTIIDEMMRGVLSEIELASFISAVYINDMTEDETVALTNAIAQSGDRLSLPKHPIADKHCTGGVANNRTTMVVVPIVAAAGIYIPKTSSRAITSAAGTADTMEVLCNVSFPIDELERIVLKNKGCIVWGGGLNLAAADDKLIKIRNPLHLDPKGMLLASILAKKKAVGAECVVIDIPVGRGIKISDMQTAEALARDFVKIGSRLGMKIEVLITDGTSPVGNGIGPALECRDVLSVLQGNGPDDLKVKSCRIAGVLLELAGKAKAGEGFAIASHILESGKAYDVMKGIIESQGGNPRIKIDDLPIGSCSHIVTATEEGRIGHIDNRILARIARAAGAPKNKGAGVYLFVDKGDKITKGQKLMEIFAESEAKLDFALDLLAHENPIELERVILETITGDSSPKC